MAKFNLIKTRYGFEPANDEEYESCKRFAVGEIIEADIKLNRNWKYHKKMFSFFNFCFEYYCADKNKKMEFMNSKAQQKEFRNNLTILAGYYEAVTDIRENTHLRALSLSYESMDQEEFEECSSAMINAALKEIFGRNTSQDILNQLYSYF